MGAMSFGAAGSVTNTTRLDADFTIDERARYIVEQYGAEAAAIVVSLAREINVGLARALDLARMGDVSFRKAGERHLAAIRATAKRNREESVRRQEREDHYGVGASLQHAVDCAMQAIERHDIERKMLTMHVRASSQAPDAREAEMAHLIARLDADLAGLQATLDSSIAARDAWQADEAKRTAKEAQ